MAGLLESYGIKEVLPTFLQRNNNNGESLYQHFLNSEIKTSVKPCLPKQLCNKHLMTLSGMYVLQINAVKNIGVSNEERQKGINARGHRTLLFELTDGTQCVAGMEFETLKLKDLNQIQYGTKIAICDVLIRRGILLLTPGNFQILGGNVNIREINPMNDVIDLSSTIENDGDDGNSRRTSY